MPAPNSPTEQRLAALEGRCTDLERGLNAALEFVNDLEGKIRRLERTTLGLTNG